MLIRKLRASDKLELWLNMKARGEPYTVMRTRQELLKVAQSEETWALWKDGELLGLGGIAQVPNMIGVGAIWFLGTDLADKNPMAMTRACKRFMRAFHKHWPSLGNVVPTCMSNRIRWLEYLGFDFSPEKANETHVAFWSHYAAQRSHQPAP